MFRKFQTAAFLTAAAALIPSAGPAQAGCHSGGYRPYPAVHHTYAPPRVVHHAVARPVVVHPPVAVAPAAPVAAHLPSVPSGATLTLPGNFLGPQPGHVFLVLHDVKLPAAILKWTPTGVTITLPPMAVKKPIPARLDVVLPHGKLGTHVKILLTPPAPLVLHASAPAPQLPTQPNLAPQAALAQGVPAPFAANQSAEPDLGIPLVLNGPQQ